MPKRRDNKFIEEEIYWKEFWNRIGESKSTDSEVDRGTSCIYPEIGHWFEKRFFYCVSPNNNELLLDAGCGTGVNLCKFSKHVKSIVGFDFSKKMIERAKMRMYNQNLNNCSLLVASITNIPIKNRFFDKTICNSVLQYFNDEDCSRAIKQIMSATKRGGLVVLHVKNSSSLYGVTMFLGKKFIAPIIKRKTTPDHYRSNNWYQKCVKNYGGIVVDCESFGLFTVPYMPKLLSKWLLMLEMLIRKGTFLKKHGVNLQLTIYIQ